eukprot:m.179774 g.179774  ORF g.179774 m.179774 type:complete len:511 (-) comp14852_c0_seq1:127-1659(-)
MDGRASGLDPEYAARLASSSPKREPPETSPTHRSPKRATKRSPGESGWPSVRSPPREQYSDRYIPIRDPRSATDSNFQVPNENNVEGRNGAASAEVRDDPGKVTYNLLLKNELLGAGVNTLGGASDDGVGSGVPSSGRKVLSFKAPLSGGAATGASLPASPYSLSPLGADSEQLLQSPRKMPRKVPKVPFKVLDAPDLQDDFYLNLVDWSSQNVLCVGLGACVYLWSACTSKVTKLCDLRSDVTDAPDLVTSVKWVGRGSHLAIGSSRGVVQIWDAVKCQHVRTMVGHTGRVGALAWNNTTLSSGSRDRKILQRDTRAPEDFQEILLSHKQEVCGLEWSPDGQHLASGGNDNKLFVWKASYTLPVHRFSDHTAAVKAIAWSPHQHGLLASGGGTADQCIRFWNTLTAQPLQTVFTKSQVCNLAWAKNSNELVSTHGYSQNQIVLWRYPSMTQIATLTGHTFRVLYLAMSPDGQTIVTGAGDETLRFWNVFSKSRSPKQSKSVLNLFTHIR